MIKSAPFAASEGLRADLPPPQQRSLAAARGRAARAAAGNAYALLATERRLFAGLADGQLWESRDQGESWTALRLDGDPLDALLAIGP